MNETQDVCLKKYALVLMLLMAAFNGKGQEISNLRMSFISLQQDTVLLDSVSVIPGSFSLWAGAGLVDTSAYTLNLATAVLVWKKNTEAYRNAGSDSLKAVYRVFPLSFARQFRHKDAGRIEKQYKGLYNPFEYNEKESTFDLFKLQGLQRSGSISRGVSFGNAQDVVVNSSLNLQLSGKLNENVEILASVSDNNVPIQAEGNTQQIQDFDKVFIQLSNRNSRLLAGDFELTRPEGYFMNFYKKGQGGVFSTRLKLDPDRDTAQAQWMNLTVSASLSKGKYARNVIQGAEANQGPYRLTGNDNEQFIVILSGSEKVFIDGQPMTRGQEFDYVIDYNTAQLTFTSKRLITKDSRITAEFQYSDKNYSRSLLYLNDTYQYKKLKLRLNVYSEQDAKNQPLLQEIDAAQKKFLSDVGDSIQQAFYPNVDSVTFSNNEVLYARRDTVTGNDTVSIYVYSVSPDSAFYRVGFSYLGPGKGNYVPLTTAANGKVYAWVARVNGVPQGSYEPYTLLVTPKKQQLLTLGADYLLGKNTSIRAEGAASNYDLNLYSGKNKRDNSGFAGMLNMQHLQALMNGWTSNFALQAEHVNKRFRPVETFRNVEFIRDWNLGTLTVAEDENSGSLSMGVSKARLHFLNYQLKTFQKGVYYKGYMHQLNMGTGYRGFTLVTHASYLLTGGSFVKSRYLRGNADLSKRIRKWVIGSNGQLEQNAILHPSADTLLYNSFAFRQWQAYITLADSGEKNLRADYTQRYDYTPRSNRFKPSTRADNVSLSAALPLTGSSRMEGGVIYRTLRVSDTTLTSQQDENSLLGHLQFDFVLLKGGLVSNSYYEIGTGQELKKEYVFIQVAPGTGTHIWNDYNNNAVKELNEFEVAAFAGEADYIKIYTPTNEYIKTRTNQFSQVISVNPSAFLKKEGFQKFLARFNDQLAVKTDNKITFGEGGGKMYAIRFTDGVQWVNLLRVLNPFAGSVNDSSLISTNTSYRNTLFFNRSSTVLGMDITFQELNGKTLLTNGFESRLQRTWNSNIRWNISKLVGLSAFGENGFKRSSSEFFSVRDFYIRYGSIEPRLSIQPNNNFRGTLSYEYKLKKNHVTETAAQSYQHDMGLELKYSSIKRGAITGKINYILITYNAADNTSLAYEMLEGLKTGKNLTWGVSAQQSLSGSLQLNVNYEGRKSEGIKTIHTGGVQLTAYF